MGRFSWKCCVVIIFLTTLLDFITANGNIEDDQLKNIGSTKLYDKKKPKMRSLSNVGRKKRNTQYEENFIPPTLEQKQIEALFEAVQDSPWAVLTVNEGKRHTVNFTPRLGRESGERSEPDNWLRDSDLTKELIAQRSPPFAPRLGRRSSPYYFDPRLGKREYQQKQL